MDNTRDGNPKVSRTLQKLTAKLRKAIKKNRMTVRFMFKAMDTDENDLIDALEFLATFALISGMSMDDKIKFMFDCCKYSRYYYFFN